MLPKLKTLPWPCEVKTITSPYGKRVVSYTDSTFHNGVDIATPFGSSLKSIDNEGTVKLTIKGASKYGNYIVVQYVGFCLLAAHLKEFKVNVGDNVQVGDEIALTGSSGLSIGPHVHIEIRDGDYGSSFFHKNEDGQFINSVDPMLYLNQDIKAERVYNKDLVYLCDQHLPPIFDSKEYWQNLMDKKKNMSEVPVEYFISALRKVVERD